MKRLILVFMLFIGTNVFGQKVGIQFYQGLNIPKVFYSGAAGALSYQSNVNSDSRVGIYFGEFKWNNYVIEKGKDFDGETRIHDLLSPRKDESFYYVLIQGKSHGPFKLGVLKAMVDVKKAPPSAFVRSSKEQDFGDKVKVRNLFYPDEET